MKERSGDELLALRVRLHGVTVGRPVDLLLDREGLRAIGFDVLCGDEVHRFLPLPTAKITADQISISSPLVLLEEDELDFYRARTVALSSLRGRAVERKRRQAGTLRDVVLGAGGELLAVLADAGGTPRRIPFDEALSFAPARRSAA
jgi:hypothetical protein